MSKVKVGPELPSETGGAVNSQGLEAARASVDVDESALQDGPRVGERNEFLPAAYRVSSGIIRVDN